MIGWIVTAIGYGIVGVLYIGCLISVLLMLNSVVVAVWNWKSIMRNQNPNGWRGGIKMHFTEGGEPL